MFLRKLICCCGLVPAICFAGEPVFQIKEVQYLPAQIPGHQGVFREAVEAGVRRLEFVPALEAKVWARADIATTGVLAKAYFFDASKHLIATTAEPAPPGARPASPSGMPNAFRQGRAQSLFFPVPKELMGRSWSAVVVVGSLEAGMAAGTFPSGLLASDFEFPERMEIARGNAETAPKQVGEIAKVPPLVEYVAKTKSQKQPQITLFFQMPYGVSDPAELRGILGRVLIGKDVADVRRQAEGMKGPPRPGSLEELAQRYKLGILCWGARTLWDKTTNADELSPEQRAEMDREFDMVAAGWVQGLEGLAARYGIPRYNVILDGVSQAAQWSSRLALRVPGRILAVHTHIASSYDMPTAMGRQTLWLLTTGEQEAGCDNAIDFYTACRRLEYPMIFKAEPGLGHEWSTRADRLAYAFFDYILRMASAQSSDAWRTIIPPQVLASFQKPEFWGDLSSQRVLPAAESREIPPENLIPLPTGEIAKAWKMEE
jgi:hypothetical protein